jgi:GT2 family glycosyltransferase
MSASVSIVMTPWNRTKLLSNTLDSIFKQKYPNLQIIVVEDRPTEFSTEALCHRHGIEYAVRRNDPNEWCNPAALLNHGIRKAKGEIIIIQNAECKYESETGIADLIEDVVNDEMVSTVPLVQSIDDRERFIQWFSHPTDQQRAGWISCFCQATRRSQILRVGGFDEIFHGYGHEDDLFEFRLRTNGVKFKYKENVLVSHQWHERYHYTGVEQQNEIIRIEMEMKIKAGEVPNIANFGKDWGQI